MDAGADGRDQARGRPAGVSRSAFTVRRLAARDLSRHAAWFKREAGVEVGRRFLAAAYDSFADLAVTPGLGAPLEPTGGAVPTTNKWRVRGFPNLLIFYAERPTGGVAIVRVLHASQDWLAALGAP